jgi:hypothetical protein
MPGGIFKSALGCGVYYALDHAATAPVLDPIGWDALTGMGLVLGEEWCTWRFETSVSRAQRRAVMGDRRVRNRGGAVTMPAECHLRIREGGLICRPCRRFSQTWFCAYSLFFKTNGFGDSTHFPVTGCG